MIIDDDDDDDDGDDDDDDDVYGLSRVIYYDSHVCMQ